MTITKLNSAFKGASATLGSYTGYSISDLNKYLFVTVFVLAGDNSMPITIPYGCTEEFFVVCALGTSQVRTGIYIDWTNNKIYIACHLASGYTYAQSKFSFVYGIIKRA